MVMVSVGGSLSQNHEHTRAHARRRVHMEGVNKMFGRGLDLLRAGITTAPETMERPALPPARVPGNASGAPEEATAATPIAARGKPRRSSRASSEVPDTPSAVSAVTSASSASGKRVVDVRSMARPELENVALKLQGRITKLDEKLRSAKGAGKRASDERDAFATALEGALGIGSAASLLEADGTLNRVALARAIKRQRQEQSSEAASHKTGQEAQIRTLTHRVERLQSQYDQARKACDEAERALVEATSSGGGELSASLARVTTELEESRAESSRLQKAVAHAEGRVAALEKEVAGVKHLRQALAEAQEQVARLEAESVLVPRAANDAVEGRSEEKVSSGPCSPAWGDRLSV
jgi:chromosome segregation ATPase